MPPTSMWTGAVYLEAAATHGIPVIFWLYAGAAGVGGVGDEEFDIVGEVAGELLGDSNLRKVPLTLGRLNARVFRASRSLNHQPHLRCDLCTEITKLINVEREAFSVPFLSPTLFI